MHHTVCIVVFPVGAYQILLMTLCLVSKELTLTSGTMCIPETFSLFCVSCVPYSPFQNFEPLLMFQVLFSHMYQTVSIESGNFSGSVLAVSNQIKDLRSISPLGQPQGKYSRKNRIFRGNYSYCICDWKSNTKNLLQNLQYKEREKRVQAA